MCVPAKSCPTLSTSWTVAHQAPVHGIFQARILEWVVISFSRGSSHPGVKLGSLASSSLVGRFFTTEPPGMPVVTGGERERGTGNIGVGGKDYYGVTRNPVCEAFEKL